MWTLLIISSRESELAVILPSNPLSLSPPVVYYVSCPSFPPSLSCDTASRCAVCSDCLSPAVPLQSICLYFRSLSILIDSYQDLLGCFRPLTHTQMLQSPNQSQRAWCLGELWLRVAPYMGVNQHQFAGWCVCGFVHDAHWCVCFCVCECVGRLIAEMVGDSHCDLWYVGEKSGVGFNPESFSLWQSRVLNVHGCCFFQTKSEVCSTYNILGTY